MSIKQLQTVIAITILIRRLNVIARNIDMDRTFINRAARADVFKQARLQAKMST